MTTSRTLRAKSPDDLLALVPYVLGFHPQESLVLLTLGDADNRLHARVDLPDDQDQFEAMARQLGEAVARGGVRRCVLVAYTDHASFAQDLVDRLADVLESVGAEVVQAIRADGERWYSLNRCPEACCPRAGTPYDVASHPITAQGVLEGQVTHGSRQELADSLIGRDREAIAEVGRFADAAIPRFLAAARHPLGPPAPEAARTHLVREGRWVGERVRRFLADGVALDAEEAARMLVAMIIIEIRDVAWAEMTRENAGRHVDLWRDLLRRAPEHLGAAPAALLGFAAWLSGDGALAWCAVERCQAVEADYGLAALLTDALAAAVPPSVWQPVRPEHLTLFAS